MDADHISMSCVRFAIADNTPVCYIQLVREKNRKLWEEKSNEFETIATGENSG